MAAAEFSLNGFWKFKGFSDLNGEELGAHLPECNGWGWLNAQVPGIVTTDLMANNLIPDPFKDLNENKAQWVSDSEWWYRKEVDLPRDLVDKQVVLLVFEGLDTFATVWVNGKQVGEANNMFISWSFNIKNALKQGRNLIAVRFKPIYKVVHTLELHYKHKYPCLLTENCSARPYVRKAQYSFGWDWAPTLPATGIWRQAKIVGFDEAKLGYLSALPLEVTKQKAKVLISGEVNAFKTLSLKAKFVVEGFGQKNERWINAEVNQGRNFIDFVFKVDAPVLWWPRGYGEPCLYDVSMELYSGNACLDKVVTMMGIRSIELLQEPDEEGTTFVLKVNGIPIFCKGANWVPADSFLPRVTQEQYSRLLGFCAEANFNMVRVWAGGVYENNAFYSLCDELGILVWQDFMYACAEYPEEDWFLKQAKKEAEEAVLRLRGHPCIVLWCGNNENQWLHYLLWKEKNHVEQLSGLPIYDVILPEVCKRLDPTRPYRPSTPFGGQDFSGRHEGHRHNWEVWSHGLDYTAYLEDNGRFLTEFGWQAPPTLEILTAYLDKQDLNPRSEAFQAHEKQKGGLELLRSFLALHYPVPEDIKRFTLYCQLNQGEALKTAVTHWRSRMFKTSGCLIWQLNDCWPAISWSLIDYGLNPKPSYYFVKRAFQPIIAPLILKQNRVYSYIINETNQTLKSNFKFEVMSFTGESLHAVSQTVTVPAFTSTLALNKTLKELPKLPTSEDCILTVTLESNGAVLYQDIRTVQEPKLLRLPKPNIKINAKKISATELELVLESDVYTKAVYLKLDGIEGEFADNFFDLIPKWKKIIKCHLRKDVSAKDFEKNLLLEVYPYNP